MNGEFFKQENYELNKLSVETLVGLISRRDLRIVYLERTILRLQKRFSMGTEAENAWFSEALKDEAEELARLQAEKFSKSSEKSGPLPLGPETGLPSDPLKDESGSGSDDSKKEKKPNVKLPSLRYPNVEKIEKHIHPESPIGCTSCGEKLVDSGLTEKVEYLDRTPAKLSVVVEIRHKHGCKTCKEGLVTAKATPRIVPGSSFSDRLLIDAVVAKFGFLIPVNRYCRILGAHGGPLNIPANTLISNMQAFGQFVKPAVELIKDEVFSEKFINADETPHKMLEGSEKKSWFFWGFSTVTAAYFETRDTRSGSVCSELLMDSNCEFLMADAFSGYGSSTKDINAARAIKKQKLITLLCCNAHARRYFKKAMDSKDAEFFVAVYQRIYKLNDATKGKSNEEILRLRAKMKPYFEAMKKRGSELLAHYSEKSPMTKAIRYFLNQYDALTKFIEVPLAPIDNNRQESLLRNPVIGRKTWLGTHSPLGGETTAIFFTLIESCKLNKVDPTAYLTELINSMHKDDSPFSPHEYSLKLMANSKNE